MRKILLGLPALCLLMACGSTEQPAVITVSSETLMHEVRATPSPEDGEYATVNPPRFMWPDKYPHLGPVLDGVPGHVDEKPAVLYRIRISQDKEFRKGVLTGERAWAFFNPFQPLAQGKWYWQHAYVTPEGMEEWSPVYQFHIGKDTPVFNPPALEKVLAQYPSRHPRVLLDADDWEDIITKNKNNPEAHAYIDKATRCLSHPLKHLQEEIDTTTVVTLTNVVQRESALIRESRKIVDREEINVEALVRAYLLTKDERFYREGISRLSEILSWQKSKYFAGDFNLGTLLSMSTSAYDGFYNLLSPSEKQLLLDNIRTIGSKFCLRHGRRNSGGFRMDGLLLQRMDFPLSGTECRRSMAQWRRLFPCQYTYPDRSACLLLAHIRFRLLCRSLVCQQCLVCHLPTTAFLQIRRTRKLA